MEDPVVHCLDGESLLLTAFPGTGKTHLAKRIVEALTEDGVITKTHAAVQNLGLGAQTADHWVRRNGHCSATWLVIEELTQLDTPLWADIACLSMNKKIRFLLLGDFRQLPAVLDGFAGAEVCRELKDSQLVPRALGALALRRVDLRVPDLAARRRARTGAAARSGAGGPAALPELPCEAAADQRAGEPTARAR